VLDLLIQSAIQAGEEVLRISKHGYTAKQKEDNSPVTDADLAANQIITTLLSERYPSIPILSEESKKSDYTIRKSWKELFIIDPIDGTKEFIKGNGEYTINIAYVSNNAPLIGVAYLPAFNKLYYGSQGNGAYLVENGVKTKLPFLKSLPKESPTRVIVSRSHRQENYEQILTEFNIDHEHIEIIRCGSSYKLCKLAEGSADIYPRLAPTQEWDIAAVQIILEEAGGFVLKCEEKTPLTYNKENLSNPFFIAGNSSIHNPFKDRG